MADPLALHWNGRSWISVPVPKPFAGTAYLTAVTALGPNDVWAVGTAQAPGQTIALSAHWNGAAWALVPAPTPPSTILTDVSAAGGTVIATGNTVEPGTARPLALKWTGTAWDEMPLPTPFGAYAEILGVAVASPSRAWAVVTTAMPPAPSSSWWSAWRDRPGRSRLFLPLSGSPPRRSARSSGRSGANPTGA